MSDPKHTPGPWEVRRGRDGYIRQVVGPKGRIVSRWNGLAAPTSNEGEANALLIAAAPRLADELSDIAKHLEAYDPHGDVQAWIRALLDYHLPQARAALREAGASIPPTVES